MYSRAPSTMQTPTHRVDVHTTVVSRQRIQTEEQVPGDDFLVSKNPVCDSNLEKKGLEGGMVLKHQPSKGHDLGIDDGLLGKDLDTRDPGQRRGRTENRCLSSWQELSLRWDGHGTRNRPLGPQPEETGHSNM